MPFVKQEEYKSNLGKVQALPNADKEVVEPDIPVSEVFSAAFSVDNNLVSNVNYYGNGKYQIGKGEVDPEYDPFEDIKGSIYEMPDFSDRFVKVNNKAEADIVKQSIDEELEARRTVEQAGGTGLLATLAAGIFDPINLIPLGVGVNAGIKGGSILKGAASAGAAGLITETASEALLQSTQEVRTAEESAVNIAAGTLFSGVLGAGGTALVKRSGRYESLMSEIEKDMEIAAAKDKDAQDLLEDEMLDGSAINGVFDDSIGAARTPITTLDQESLIGTFGIAKATAFLNPVLRLAHSPSRSARIISQELMENPVYFNKNKEGIATPQAVETLRKQYEGGLAEAIGFQQKQYKEYKAANKGKPMLNFMEFQEEVAKAMRRNDTSSIPQADVAAKKFRIKVFEPLKRRAIEEDLLPEGVTVKTADSYLMRVWDKNKIIQHEPEFRDIVSNWVGRNAQSAVDAFKRETNAKLSKLNADLKRAKNAAEEAKIKAKIDDFKVERGVEERTFFDTDNNFESYIDEVTDDIVRTLKGYDGVSPTYSVKIAKRGPLKERVFNIPDEEVEFYLSNDMEALSQRYTKVMGTDVELKGKFGSTTLDEQFKKIDADYLERSKQVKTQKERQKLDEQRDGDKKDLQAVLDIMRGVGYYTADPSNRWVKLGRTARTLNYVRLLGQVALSSFADVARPVMVHGMARYMKTMPKVLANVEGYKLSKAEAKKAGQITELELNGRIATLAEIGDPYANGSAFSRIMQNMANTFSKVTLMAHWNNYGKSIASTMTMDRILGNIGKGKLSKSEQRYMAFLGIDSDKARLMNKQFEKYGQTENGIRVANTDLWDRQDLARMFKAAMNKDVDRTIVTKGVGDVPLFANSEIGKTFFQFKSFAMAAHQRVLISGMQQGDMAALNGMIFAITAGMMTYTLKEIAKGNKVPDDPNKLLIEGIDWSGLIPVFMEANNTLEKVGAPGLARLAGAAPASRFRSRNLSGTFIGPTAGMVNDIGTTARAAFTQELSKSDVRAMRRLLPYQNLFYVRQLFDELEASAARELGAK